MSRLLFSLLTVAVWAQAAQQSGTVRSAGLPIPGATVTAMQGGARLVTATADDGSYSIDELTPGTWTIEVRIFGFTAQHKDVDVSKQTEPVTWDLEVAPSSKDDLPAAPPTAATPPPAPTGKQAKNPPPRNAEFQDVTLNAIADPQNHAPDHEITPQVDATVASDAFLVSGSVTSGLAAPQNEEFIDRAKASWQRSLDGNPQMQDTMGGGPDGMSGGMPGNAPPPGFSTSSSRGRVSSGGGFDGSSSGRGSGRGMSSKAGKSTRGRDSHGMQRQAMSFGNKKKKSGGFHGSVSYTMRDSDLDARPYSFNGNIIKPEYMQNRISASGGGGIAIPKVSTDPTTFIYLNYQGNRSNRAVTDVATLPSLLERSGDFSQSWQRGPVSIFDPLGNTQFPGNVIPASRFNPASAGLLKYIPLTNQPGLLQNFTFVGTIPQNYDQIGIRVTQPLSRKDRISWNYNSQHNSSNSAQTYGFMDDRNGQGFSSSLSYSHSFKPRLNSNFTFNFSRNRNQTLPFFANKDDVATQLGITGTSHDPLNYGPPNLSFTNFGGLADASASLRRDQSAGLTENLTYVLKKKHNLNFGFTYRRLQQNSKTDQNARGSFTFSGLKTSLLDANSSPITGTGFDFADFLLGLPQSSTIRFGANNTYFRQSAYNAYAVDDWRIHAHLTLNIGLRYEYFSPYHEKFGHMSNLDVAPFMNGVAVVLPGQIGPYTGEFPEGLIDPQKTNFSPRFGFAWRPPFARKSHLQFRGGYGIFIDGSSYGTFPAKLASQPPFANNASLTTSLANVLTLQNGFPTQIKAITNSFAIDRNYRLPYAQTWNFNLQQTLHRSLVTEIGYMGTKGTRLDIQRLPNRAMPGSPLTAEQRRIIGNATGFTWDTSVGNSVYHQGFVRLIRRFQQNMSGNLEYRYSKSIDNASTIGGGGNIVAQNDLDLRAERGLSSFDQRHFLQSAFMLTSPVGEFGLLRGGGWKLKLLRNWTLSGTMSYASGTPLTARVLGTLSNSGGVIGAGRADASGLPIQGDAGQFFNGLAFTLPPTGRFGNAGRNTIPGPNRFLLGASFGRNFRLGETRRSIDARIDSQNVLNHVSYTGFGTVVNASNYGLATAANAMRSINITLRFRF